MAEVKWIKLTVDMFDDEKIKIIQSMPDGDTLLVIWIRLLTLAGKTNDNGYIYIAENIPYTEEMLSVILNKPILTIRLAIETFTNLQMIDTDTKGIYLVNFEKHQSLEKMAKIKEQNRKRQAKFKEKKKARLTSGNAKVTQGNAKVTQKVTQGNATDIDKEEDKDKEKDTTKVVVIGADAPDYDNDNKLDYFNKNLILSENQVAELLDIMGLEVFDEYTARLSAFIEELESKGQKPNIKSHFQTLLKWYNEDRKVGA